MVEEYTVMAKRVISYLILTTTVIYVLFIFMDHLPWSMVLCGLATQAMHALIMTNFPYVKFTSLGFFGGLLLLIINHFLAFQFFAQNYYTFTEVSVFVVNKKPSNVFLSHFMCFNDLSIIITL